jgi:hypothetical protein
LVERLLCKQDVNGSSPLTSTGATRSEKPRQREKSHTPATYLEKTREPAEVKLSKNLENCIETCQVVDYRE